MHPRVVMAILGHCTITPTMGTYAHVPPEAHRRAAAAIEGLPGPPRTDPDG